jgi:hypothetical protein
MPYTLRLETVDLRQQKTVSHSASRLVVNAIPASPLNAPRLNDVLCVWS